MCALQALWLQHLENGLRFVSGFESYSRLEFVALCNNYLRLEAVPEKLIIYDGARMWLCDYSLQKPKLCKSSSDCIMPSKVFIWRIVETLLWICCVVLLIISIFSLTFQHFMSCIHVNCSVYQELLDLSLCLYCRLVFI